MRLIKTPDGQRIPIGKIWAYQVEMNDLEIDHLTVLLVKPDNQLLTIEVAAPGEQEAMVAFVYELDLYFSVVPEIDLKAVREELVKHGLVKGQP